MQPEAFAGGVHLPWLKLRSCACQPGCIIELALAMVQAT